ncbi:MAG: enoyl-CoA hydratase/isomerase family protein [Syntrophales bacterium]|jgi:enoyl-CoA hydratase
MDYETIQFEKEGPVGILTLNRPKSLNAMNFVMLNEFRDFWNDRFRDHETRVIVITGAGKGFNSGLDMGDPDIMIPKGGYTPKIIYEMQKLFSDFILFMRRCPQPVIGAINGAAAGAGFSISMACDVRLAAPEAKFSAAYINIGTGGADMGSSWLFPRLVGTGNAARYLMTGDFFGAEEALRIGFVQAIVDKESLLGEAVKMAQTMAGKSPLGLRLTKEALNRNTGGLSLEDAIQIEDRNQAMCVVQTMTQNKTGV